MPGGWPPAKAEHEKCNRQEARDRCDPEHGSKIVGPQQHQAHCQQRAEEGPDGVDRLTQPERCTAKMGWRDVGNLCPVTVRKSLENVPGVSRARIDFERKTATVSFDADKATVPALVKATTEAGYPSTVRK